MSDNEIFNVNGESRSFLRKAVILRFDQSSENAKRQFTGYRIDKKKGMILSVYPLDEGDKFTPFPFQGFESQLDFVWSWLNSEDAKEIECKGQDANMSHDGHNVRGFRCYTEDWGHVGDCMGFLAIKPVYLWMGK
jgi:hypothetical protein